MQNPCGKTFKFIFNKLHGIEKGFYQGDFSVNTSKFSAFLQKGLTWVPLCTDCALKGCNFIWCMIDFSDKTFFLRQLVFSEHIPKIICGELRLEWSFSLQSTKIKSILNIFLRIFQNFIICYFSFSSSFVLKKWPKQFTILQNSDKSFSICWPLSVLPLSMLIIIITNVKLKFFCKICNARTKIHHSRKWYLEWNEKINSKPIS